MLSVIFSTAVIFHVLAVVIWVGGMFFAHMILRPTMMKLPSELRISFGGQIFARFFYWVWGAIFIILTTGYGVILGIFGGFTRVPLHIHLMMGTGNLMVLFFCYLWFFPYRALRAALIIGNHATVNLHQTQIRQIITINLLLGITTISIAIFGRLYGLN